jgi:hypothetical protein
MAAPRRRDVEHSSRLTGRRTTVNPHDERQLRAMDAPGDLPTALGGKEDPAGVEADRTIARRCVTSCGGCRPIEPSSRDADRAPNEPDPRELLVEPLAGPLHDVAVGRKLDPEGIVAEPGPEVLHPRTSVVAENGVDDGPRRVPSGNGLRGRAWGREMRLPLARRGAIRLDPRRRRRRSRPRTGARDLEQEQHDNRRGAEGEVHLPRPTTRAPPGFHTASAGRAAKTSSRDSGRGPGHNRGPELRMGSRWYRAPVVGERRGEVGRTAGLICARAPPNAFM